MRVFNLYRAAPPIDYLKLGLANPPEEIQLQGIEWEDGTVSIRWLTRCPAFQNWNSLSDFLSVHGHPAKYETRIEWLINAQAVSESGVQAIQQEIEARSESSENV